MLSGKAFPGRDSGPDAEPSEPYAAVPFVYEISDPDALQELTQKSIPQVPAAPAVPDIPFTPTFAVPASVQNHLPTTERMHKVCCFELYDVISLSI